MSNEHATTIQPTARRGAAVAVVLSRVTRNVSVGGDLLLVRRATYAGDPWSGHIALPGGRHEPGDRTLEDTARRETLEETGIDLRDATCLAALPELVPRAVHLPALVIRPYVFAYRGDRTVMLSPELAEAWWHPIAALSHSDAWETLDVPVGEATRAVRGYRWREHVIWGITERILAELFARPDLIERAAAE